MLWQSLASLLKWLVSLTVLAGLLGLAHLVLDEAKEELRKEIDKKGRPNQPRPGEVKLDLQEVKELGLQTTKAQAKPRRERLVVYGRVVPNPRATVELRPAWRASILVQGVCSPATSLPGRSPLVRTAIISPPASSRRPRSWPPAPCGWSICRRGRRNERSRFPRGGLG